MSVLCDVSPERESWGIALRRPRAPFERPCRLFIVVSCVLLGAGGCVPGSSELTDTLPTTGGATVSSDPSTATISTGASSLPPTGTDDPPGSSASSSDGGTSQATTISTSASSGPCDTPIGGLVTSHAYYESQIPDIPGTAGTTISTGSDVDPDTLYITLSDASITCEDPDAALDCGPLWSVSLVLPPELQTPGSYAVGTDELNYLFVETGVDDGEGSCPFGAGSWEATLELISIGDGVVEGRLCDVDIGWMTVAPTLDGLFTAELCP